MLLVTTPQCSPHCSKCYWHVVSVMLATELSLVLSAFYQASTTAVSIRFQHGTTRWGILHIAHPATSCTRITVVPCVCIQHSTLQFVCPFAQTNWDSADVLIVLYIIPFGPAVLTLLIYKISLLYIIGVCVRQILRQSFSSKQVSILFSCSFFVWHEVFLKGD